MSWPIFYTATALVAFAGNSVLCRLALGEGTLDAATFTTIRLAAGAAMLLLVSASKRAGGFRLTGSWISAVMLCLYAVPFSFAYISLSTGMGALILFGTVQVTMMLAALWAGERPRPLQWLGLGLALMGLVYLVLPGLAAPSAIGSASMGLAGTSWGIYSLRGRGATDPLAETTSNFVRALPLAVAVSVVARAQAYISLQGALLATASGALTSGLGYVVWYAAIRRITATRAAVVQLIVPVLAAGAGVLFLGETISARLVIAATVVLGGIGMALLGREQRR